MGVVFVLSHKNSTVRCFCIFCFNYFKNTTIFGLHEKNHFSPENGVKMSAEVGKNRKMCLSDLMVPAMFCITVVINVNQPLSKTDRLWS